jgi:hypothetical protein
MDTAADRSVDARDVYRVAAGMRALSVYYPLLVILAVGIVRMERLIGGFPAEDLMAPAWAGALVLLMVLSGDAIHRMARATSMRWPLVWAVAAAATPPFGLLPAAIVWLKARRILEEQGVQMGRLAPDRDEVERLREAAGEAAPSERDVYSVATGLRTLTIWFPLFFALLMVSRIHFGPAASLTEDQFTQYMFLMFGIFVSGIVVFDSVFRMASGLNMRLPTVWALAALLVPVVRIVVAGWLWYRGRAFLPKNGIEVGLFGPTRRRVGELKLEAEQAALCSEAERLEQQSAVESEV